MLSRIESNHIMFILLISFLIIGGIDLYINAYKYHKFEKKTWIESFKTAIKDFFYLY